MVARLPILFSRLTLPPGAQQNTLQRHHIVTDRCNNGDGP